MPSEVTVVGPEGGAATVIPRRTMEPGPGEFVSRGGRWYPAERPKTIQAVDPRNPERKIDVPIEVNGKVIKISDPAAVATIKTMTNGKSDSLTITAFPEQKDPMKDLLSAFVQGQNETNKRIEMLCAAIAGKEPAKRGRPPKVKPE